MSAEYTLKKQIDKIIENAFYDIEEDKKKRYKWFKLVLSDTSFKSFSGRYIPAARTVEVYDITDQESNNISTLLHEVAHHIDYCNTIGGNGHQKEFYDIYIKLIYSALDLNKIKLEEFKKMKYRNTDYNKIQKILDKYVRQEPHIKINEDELIVIKISDGFDYKSDLFKLQYHWNKLTKTWDKEDINKEDLDNEKRQILNLGIKEENIEVKESKTISLSKKAPNFTNNYIGYIHVLGNTYYIKDKLKKKGCFWDKDLKIWKKGIKTEDEITEFVYEINQLDSKLKTDYVKTK